MKVIKEKSFARNMKPKIIALYLPQFHQIPENDEFWGEGFTDWVTVKNAKPLFEGHRQPKIPLNNNYYDLSIKENVEWQSKLAADHGIYGFGVYHYWFNNEKNLLTKPAEIMRGVNDLPVKYFFVWDNCLWKRSWSNVDGNAWSPVGDEKASIEKSQEILIPYELGKEDDWRIHYEYLKTHFLSDNYEKRNNMPIFSIINYDSDIKRMCDYWNILAKRDGFNGIFFIFRDGGKYKLPAESYRYVYEPHRSWKDITLFRRIVNKICRILRIDISKSYYIYDYDDIWRKLLKNIANHPEKNYLPGAFVGYDDSPRRGNVNSVIIENSSPQKFEMYFRKLLDILTIQNKEYLFFTAWNEWGEGAYLEPDNDTQCEYLKTIKRVLSPDLKI